MVNIITGDCRDVLASMKPESIDCCVTSPPYWGLRDYGVDGQLGLEATPDQFVGELSQIMAAVRGVLKPEGTLWLNLGDSYNAYNANRGPAAGANKHNHAVMPAADRGLSYGGLKNKDLLGMPWRVAFRLQADGWYLRQDIIWSKPNPMPESVGDRCTKAHEYLFLLSKAPRYYYDAEAIREPAVGGFGHNGVQWAYTGDDTQGPRRERYHSGNRVRKPRPGPEGDSRHQQGSVPWEGDTRTKRSVWHIPTQPCPDAHFATFPEALVRPCILAGCPQNGTVLDPFGGSGTVGRVAEDEGRNSVLIELNPEYVAIAERRTAQQGLFTDR